MKHEKEDWESERALSHAGNDRGCAREWEDEAVLSDGKTDLAKVKPLLFDMTSKKYWSLGPAVGSCWSVGKQYKKL